MDHNNSKVPAALNSRKASLTPIIHTVPWDSKISWLMDVTILKLFRMIRPLNNWHNISCNRALWSLHKFIRAWKVSTIWLMMNNRSCQITIKSRTTTKWFRPNTISILLIQVMGIFNLRDPRLKRSFDIRVNSPPISTNITLIPIMLRHHRLWSRLQLPVLITARINSSICTSKSLACLKRINKLKISPDWGRILSWSNRSTFMKDKETMWWLSKRPKISRWHS